ncbi:MAG: glycosyltransferase [Parachlamydiales bacterium]|nr:glycosyltransferase [Parachlamydiales bacterium]
MMKDIIITKRLIDFSGGLEKTALYILQYFAQRSKVTLLTSYVSSKISLDPHITVIKAPATAHSSKKKILEFDSFCQNHVQQFPKALVLGLDRTTHQTHLRLGNGVHKALLNTPLYTPFHSLFPKHRFLLSLEKKAFTFPPLQKIITNSHYVRQQLIQYYHTDPQKIQVIHNGVEWQDMESFYQISSDKKQEILSEYHLPQEKFHFVFIGSGYRRKGLLQLLLALHQIRTLPFHLSVIGKDKKINSYKKWVHKLQLREKVSFWPYQKNPIPFYQIADCVVIPSYYDPFANVTLEALSMGVFVITSSFNGAKEIITDQNGLITNILNISHFANDLQCSMATPKTSSSAKIIRESVKHYDFSQQLAQFFQAVVHE